MKDIFILAWIIFLCYSGIFVSDNHEKIYLRVKMVIKGELRFTISTLMLLVFLSAITFATIRLFISEDIFLFIFSIHPPIFLLLGLVFLISIIETFLYLLTLTCVKF